MVKICPKCHNVFASGYTLKRHVEKFHPENDIEQENEEEESEGTILVLTCLKHWYIFGHLNNTSGSDEEEEDMATDQEAVEYIGDFLRDAIEELEDMDCMEDLLNSDKYTILANTFKEKVVKFIPY